MKIKFLKNQNYNYTTVKKEGNEHVNNYIKLLKTQLSLRSYSHTQQPKQKPPHSLRRLAEKCLCGP